MVQAKAGKGSATLVREHVLEFFFFFLVFFFPRKKLTSFFSPFLAPRKPQNHFYHQSMAYAGALFADACLRGLNGEPNVVECTYVESELTPARFFASKVRLGPSGVDEILGLGKLTEFEQAGLDKLLPELQESIAKGEKFVTESS